MIARIGLIATALLLSQPGATHEGVRTASHVPLAQGTFLVANRELSDPNFARTVVLILRYGPEGATGVIVNRRTDLTLAELLPDVKSLGKIEDTVYLGGPVSPEELLMLVRSPEAPDDSLPVFEDVWISDSLDLLERLSKKRKKSEFRVYAGYAGWAPLQLDAEVARGDWLVVEAHGDIVFHDKPAGVWRRLVPPEENPFVTALRPRPVLP